MAKTKTPELVADPRIDWAKRADGKTHVLKLGKHYTREPLVVRKAAGMFAHRHGYSCHSRHTDTEIYVRFTPKTKPV